MTRSKRTALVRLIRGSSGACSIRETNGSYGEEKQTSSSDSRLLFAIGSCAICVLDRTDLCRSGSQKLSFVENLACKQNRVLGVVRWLRVDICVCRYMAFHLSDAI